MELNGLLGSLLSPSTFGGSSPPQRLRTSGDAATTADPSAGSGGVLAEISDAARSLFAQMKQRGIAAESFDLHLDLSQLGMSVGAQGSRSLEGHSLSVDLHVDASQGDQGQQQFHLSFEVQETYVKATEQQQAQQADPTQAQSGQAPTQGDQAAQNGGGLVASLKKLVDLLNSSNGQPDQADGLGGLLAQIGKALEAMAQRQSGQANQAAQPSQGQDQNGDGFQLQVDVHVHAISITQSAVDDGQDPDPSKQAPAVS